jgi:membrane protease YdiL (CAAX protease family)
VPAVVAGVLLSQVVAYVVANAAGRGAMVAAGLVLADLVLLTIVLVVAARGAERLGPATFGIRRTAFGPALGWGLSLLVLGFAVDGVLALIFGASGNGRHHHEHAAHLAAGTAILVTLGVAVTAPLAEEVSFRGYLFPALTRHRGPWVGAALTAVLFGAAHWAALPAPFLLGAAAFGFGACLLFWFTGSLLPGVLVHSFNNAIVLTLVTGGQLAWALLIAPLLCLLILLPLARERAPAAS